MRELALAHRAVLHLGAGIDFAQPQSQQLRGQAPFGFLQRLVAARSRGLALQVTDLLVDFVAHVLQALEVLARVGDARLGLLAALLVTRDAGGLFDEGAHVVGLGLDDARDHALLDDGVAARAQAGSEEQLRDVLAAAARAIEEIVRRPVARHLALERHLGVVGIRPGDLAVAVVEHQFDRGGAHRLARRRAVEDDVGHRVAAQVLRGQLAHHPAHRVDDVGFAAAVGADDAGEIAWKSHGGRVGERLESSNFDLGQAHLFFPERGERKNWRRSVK